MSKKRKLTAKQRIFVDEYLQCWNASEAARRAKYTGNPNTVRQAGVENLSKPIIKDEIQARLTKSAMSADEALLRLAEFARSDLGEFEDILDGSTNLSDHPHSHLIKKIKKMSRKDKDGNIDMVTEIELYNAHEAVRDIGRHWSLFTDKVEHSGSVKNTLIILPSKDDDK